MSSLRARNALVRPDGDVGTPLSLLARYPADRSRAEQPS